MAYDTRQYWSSLHEERSGKLTAVGYSALGEGFNAVTYERRLQVAEQVIARWGAPRSLLEGAVGVGAYGDLWERIGVVRWVGLDISADAVAKLKQRYPKHRFAAVDLADREAEGWREVDGHGPYEVVTAIDVLYHLVDDAAFGRALAGLAERVAPGGLLLVSDVVAQEPTNVAAHVRRRPLAAYQAVLQPLGFELAGRAPVFAFLGDPVVRKGFHPLDWALALAWRIVQKAIRSTPAALRDGLGRALARGLGPLDRWVCAMGLSRGVNLELIAYRRGG